MSEIRISPDGRDVAIRNRDDRWFPWRVTDGSQRADSQVADWTVLTATPNGPEPRTDANGRPDQPHHGVDCPGDACRYAADEPRTDAAVGR